MGWCAEKTSMKILNLYAGIGGNRKFWTPNGDEHEITAVEYKQEIADIYHDFFPRDTVLVEDAHEYLLKHYKEFDFIWSSPPCPTHSKARYAFGVRSGNTAPIYPDMKLYQEIILLKTHFFGKWCVENVIAYYEPLIIPQMVGRHFYWSNFFIPPIKVEPTRISQAKKTSDYEHNRYVAREGQLRAGKIKDFEKRYGYDLSMYEVKDKLLMLRNCVEPETGRHILDCATGAEKKKELPLFKVEKQIKIYPPEK